MKVNILRGYRGKASGERWLAPGEHDLEPGLAKYLVDNRHAAYSDLSERSHIPKAEQVKRELESAEVIKFDPFEATKAELQNALDMLEMEYSTRDNKDVLIALYQDALSKQS